MGAGSARSNQKMGAPETENRSRTGFTVLRGDLDHGLRRWSRKGPDHGVGVDPRLLALLEILRCAKPLKNYKNLATKSRGLLLGDNKRDENPSFGNVLSGLRWLKVA